MKKRWKKIMILALAGCLLSSLAACASTDTGGSDELDEVVWGIDA